MKILNGIGFVAACALLLSVPAGADSLGVHATVGSGQTQATANVGANALGNSGTSANVSVNALNNSNTTANATVNANTADPDANVQANINTDTNASNTTAQVNLNTGAGGDIAASINAGLNAGSPVTGTGLLGNNPSIAANINNPALNQKRCEQAGSALGGIGFKGVEAINCSGGTLSYNAWIGGHHVKISYNVSKDKFVVRRFS